MRLGVTGPVPENTAVEDLGYIGSVFGDRRKVNWIETDQGLPPVPPLPPRDFPQRRRRRRSRLVCRVRSPHPNVIPYKNAEPTVEDWADHRVSIWRC